jgi:hypothetical protein
MNIWVVNFFFVSFPWLLLWSYLSIYLSMCKSRPLKWQKQKGRLVVPLGPYPFPLHIYFARKPAASTNALGRPLRSCIGSAKGQWICTKATSYSYLGSLLFSSRGLIMHAWAFASYLLSCMPFWSPFSFALFVWSRTKPIKILQGKCCPPSPLYLWWNSIILCITLYIHAWKCYDI